MMKILMGAWMKMGRTTRKGAMKMKSFMELRMITLGRMQVMLLRKQRIIKMMVLIRA